MGHFWEHERFPHRITVRNVGAWDADWHNYGFMGLVSAAVEFATVPEMAVILNIPPKADIALNVASLVDVPSANRLEPSDIVVIFMGISHYFDSDFNFKFYDS